MPRDVIVVHGTDSENESDSDHQPRFKKRRTESPCNKEPARMHQHQTSALSSNTALYSKNSSLKGRKRFKADLQDLIQECGGDNTAEINGVKLSSFASGEDEGSMTFDVAADGGDIPVNLIVSDTSDYPFDHTLFASSDSSSMPSHVSAALGEVSTFPSLTIQDAITRFLEQISQSANVQGDQESIAGDSDGSEGEFDYYDSDEEVIVPKSKLEFPKLHRHWNEIVASGYRPGLLRFGGDAFIISVSVPIIKLTGSISPRALMAWDRRLLAKTQHLTLLISPVDKVYPLQALDARPGTGKLVFRVGLTAKYKPSVDAAKETTRTFGTMGFNAEDQLELEKEQERERKRRMLIEQRMEVDGEEDPDAALEEENAEEEEVEDPGRFDRFSLSHSLESLLNGSFLKVLRLRKEFKIGWAGAEMLNAETEQNQAPAEEMYAKKKKQIAAADKEERRLARRYDLPADPLSSVGEDGDINLPLVAFSYLVRRFTLCTRFCVVCHNPLQQEFEVLKPTVCDNKLCSYQYYCHNQGSSLEYEILHNPETVDLLLSLTYTAAVENALDDPLPVGMNLRVPLPSSTDISSLRSITVRGMPGVPGQPAPPKLREDIKNDVLVDDDGLCEFDDLGIVQMRAAVRNLISTLPSVDAMRKHLSKKVSHGKVKPTLKSMDSTVPAAAWLIMRWVVGSCTAHIEETRPEDEIRNLDSSWRQFRFSVGAPDALAKFNAAVADSQVEDSNAVAYPCLYAFHGSPLRNWHSIIRNGLWFKSIAHGRAYGNGVYLAKDLLTSAGHYATASGDVWGRSALSPTSCVALAEVVNQPTKFVSSSPHLVVQHTHWIMCRYLLIKGLARTDREFSESDTIPLVRIDPKHPTIVPSKSTAAAASINSHSGPTVQVQIPEPGHQIEQLINARLDEFEEDDNDAEDNGIFHHGQKDGSKRNTASQQEVIEIDDDDDEDDAEGDEDWDDDEDSSRHVAAKGKAPVVDDWKHDSAWVQSGVEHLIPPPSESSPSATMAVQRELKAMLKEQDSAKSLKELGWHLPEDFIGDNLFQWVVEMHSFDPDIPIAKDMKTHGVNSIIFEIRFPPSFPLAPPFFRIIKPRFLPFIRGGGGHITGGGSICMDLLTSDGWLPSYNIASILLQIKLAISNLDPRPARLSGGTEWQVPYSVNEALEGYMRAAKTHGWKVPQGLDKLVLR